MQWGIIGAIALGVIIFVAVIAAGPPPPGPPPPLPGPTFRFLAIGSYGRSGAMPPEPEGAAAQVLAANILATVAGRFKPDVIISTGDNFFEGGLKSGAL